jgi:hypothetical protein
MPNSKHTTTVTSTTKYNTITVSVLIKANHAIDDATQRVVRDHADALAAEVLVTWAKSDPLGQAEADEWMKSLLACFPEGSYDPAVVTRIPNQYCSDSCCVNRAWLLAHTRRGPVTIGPRKRVIEISWTNAIPLTSSYLFPNETVTKEDRLIHAWGLENAKEYVTKLLTAPIPVVCTPSGLVAF